jgi:hypothetical protein
MVGGGTTGKWLHSVTIRKRSLAWEGTDKDCTMLLSGGLRWNEVYELAGYTVVHSMKYPSPVMSFGIISQNTSFVVEKIVTE